MTPVEQFLIWGTIATLLIICIVTIQIIKQQHKQVQQLYRENEILNRDAAKKNKLINELTEQVGRYQQTISKIKDLARNFQ